MITLSLSYNNFTNLINFQNLNNLNRMFLSNNQLNNSINLNELYAPSLKYLDLSINQLYGTINLTNLPYNLSALYLINNNFNGPIDFKPIQYIRNNNSFV